MTATHLSNRLVHPTILVQAINEVPLIVLTSDDTLLCTQHTRSLQVANLG